MIPVKWWDRDVWWKLQQVGTRETLIRWKVIVTVVEISLQFYFVTLYYRGYLIINSAKYTLYCTSPQLDNLFSYKLSEIFFI